MEIGSPLLWIVFHVGVLAMIAIDLFVSGRKEGGISTKAAAVWTLVWIALALLFGGWIWWRHGLPYAAPWFTAYIVEESLSVDNLFVFLMVFGYFNVRPEHQHRLLYWGVLGAFVLRGLFVALGVGLAKRFEYVLVAFGVFLLWTSYKMFRSKEDEAVDPEDNKVLVFARRFLPIAQGDTGKAFFVRQDGKLKATALFLVLLVIESTDLLFAVDSIPAVLGVVPTQLEGATFIAYTSNVAAVLGLRSLFFVVASLIDRFHYLKIGLSVVLGFVGLKMIAETVFHVRERIGNAMIVGSLAFIGLTLAASVLASLLWPRRPAPESADVSVGKHLSERPR